MTPTTTTAEPTTTVQGEVPVPRFKIYWKNLNRKFYLYHLVPDCVDLLVARYPGGLNKNYKL